MAQKYNDIYKEKLIELFISGEKITDIASKLDVERQTIYNWLDREDVKAELDKRRQQVSKQCTELIVKDLKSYIDNIKELANDKSDKRTSLAANKYLIDRVYGTPSQTIVSVNDGKVKDIISIEDLESELDEFDEE